MGRGAGRATVHAPHERQSIAQIAFDRKGDWYMDGRIEIDPMITHTMPLNNINKAFDLMREGKSIRSVVIF